MVLALPSASAETINALRLAAMEAGLAVKVLPAATQLLHDHVGIRDLRDINLTDVLGRNQLDTDVASIAELPGGSAGAGHRRRRLHRRPSCVGRSHRFGPAELMMLDRDESALHAVQLSIHGRALLDSNEVILCDIRDQAAVNAVFLSGAPRSSSTPPR